MGPHVVTQRPELQARPCQDHTRDGKPGTVRDLSGDPGWPSASVTLVIPVCNPPPSNQLRFPNIDTNSLTNERQFLPNHGAERQEPSEKTRGQTTDGRGRGVSSKRNRQTCQTEDGGLPAGGRREARHEVLKPEGKDAVLGTARQRETSKRMAEPQWTG